MKTHSPHLDAAEAIGEQMAATVDRISLEGHGRPMVESLNPKAYAVNAAGFWLERFPHVLRRPAARNAVKKEKSCPD